jgi:hypothetical protein
VANDSAQFVAMFSQEPAPIQQWRCRFINERWRQLNALRDGWIEKALNFLILTNAGGAVAVLSFMGASDDVRGMWWPRIALCCFSLGVIFAGIFIAKQFHRLDSLFFGYHVDSERYLSDQIEWDALRTRDDDRSKVSFIDYLCGYVPFGLFIFGCVAGAISLFA